MIKKYIFCVGLSLLALGVKAQHYALFGTRTMFDGFENPAIKTFRLDSSGKYASNFLFPNFGLTGANKGDAQDVVRRAMNEGVFTTRGLAIGDGIPNTLFQHSNVYLATFKIFRHYKYSQEFGFAWQVRTDGKVDYTNESLAVIDTYRRFENVPYNDVFRTSGYAQSYHQFSFSVRENWDKRLAFGLKVSLLSGMTYNEIHVDKSYIYADVAADKLDIGLAGRYRGSFLYKDDISRKTFFPTFKNPGASISFGTTYNSRSGFFMMGNVKDLGFIKWNKNSYIAHVNRLKTIVPVSTYSSDDVNEELKDFIDEVDVQGSFYSPTNAKADFLLSRTFNFYKPSLIVSKNLFHAGGDVALVNTFSYGNVSASLTPAYNFNDFVMFGVQAMYQSPNFEFFVGTDNLGKSLSAVRGLSKQDATVGTGYLGGAVYMGLGIKFGKTVNHPMNLSTMPGVNGEKPYKGFFRSLFTLFQRKDY